jgi:hypothetical protein
VAYRTMSGILTAGVGMVRDASFQIQAIASRHAHSDDLHSQGGSAPMLGTPPPQARVEARSCLVEPMTPVVFLP